MLPPVVVADVETLGVLSVTTGPVVTVEADPFTVLLLVLDALLTDTADPVVLLEVAVLGFVLGRLLAHVTVGLPELAQSVYCVMLLVVLELVVVEGVPHTVLAVGLDVVVVAPLVGVSDISTPFS